MKALQTVKKYMVPFLREYGFEIVKTHLGMIVFQHKENPDLRIFFEIDKGEIGPRIRRDDTGLLPSYPLTMFLNEPSEMEIAVTDDFWHFDTEEDLIGALEEQANLLINKAFDWLFRRTDLDIEAILIENANKRKNEYEAADNLGKEILINESMKRNKEWKERRVRPVNWK
jgi:hypothetical protein